MSGSCGWCPTLYTQSVPVCTKSVDVCTKSVETGGRINFRDCQPATLLENLSRVALGPNVSRTPNPPRRGAVA